MEMNRVDCMWCKNVKPYCAICCWKGWHSEWMNEEFVKSRIFNKQTIRAYRKLLTSQEIEDIVYLKNNKWKLKSIAALYELSIMRVNEILSQAEALM